MESFSSWKNLIFLARIINISFKKKHCSQDYIILTVNAYKTTYKFHIARIGSSIYKYEMRIRYFFFLIGRLSVWWILANVKNVPLFAILPKNIYFDGYI